MTKAIDLKSLEEKGWYYYLSPDKIYIVRLKEVSIGHWLKEMFKIKPLPRMAHAIRAAYSEPGYKLPDVFEKTWTKLTPNAARIILSRKKR